MKLRYMLFTYYLLALLLMAHRHKLKVAATPPMGWNSYNCFGSAVHEDEVKANTDYMAEKLKSLTAGNISW
jgi:alpha-galactosidase